jgi:hypothetical protein
MGFPAEALCSLPSEEQVERYIRNEDHYAGVFKNFWISMTTQRVRSVKIKLLLLLLLAGSGCTSQPTRFSG